MQDSDFNTFFEEMMVPKMGVNLCAFMLGCLLISKLNLTTGYSSCYENGHDGGIKFESLNVFKPTLIELLRDTIYFKWKYSDVWIFDLAGKSVRKK